MTTATVRIGSRLKVDRVRFTFDGREHVGQRGDSAASALLAQGVRVFGRSVKYHRPRGLLAVGPEEPNALLTVGTPPQIIPNLPAPQLILENGFVLRSQNRWPTLRYDLASILTAGSGIFGAGFYYKTFIWPSWRSYEKIIRNLAGLGGAPGAANPQPTATEHFSCDVLIGGAGPGGLAAALAAARAGAHVVICEREPEIGGELEFERATVDNLQSIDWISAARAELVDRGARLLTETTIVGESDGLVIAHAEPGGCPGRSIVYRVSPGCFVIAMGAVERPIVFVNNDKPGVLLLGAAERLFARYGVVVGERPILFGNHNRLYTAAARMIASGIRVRAIVDSRSASVLETDRAASEARAKLSHAGVECLAEHAVIAAEGGITVQGARVVSLMSTSSARRLECDTILVSGGWSPAIHAGMHEIGVPRFVQSISAFVADGESGWRLTTGAASGVLELSEVMSHGYLVGAQAARATGHGASVGPPPLANGDGHPSLVSFWRSPASLHQERHQFVDFQNDVTVADLRQAIGEGFTNIEHVKRYTTLGTGTDQGRTSSVLGAAIISEVRAANLEQVGVSRTRMPYHPVTIAALAGNRVGEKWRVSRKTLLHEWHQAHGGVLEPAGYWMRPRFYHTSGSDVMSAGLAEAARVRARGGIFDASTLGKIEVAGKSAAPYLDRLYLTKASTIDVGRSRYMVNMREDGMVLDDGIVLRLAQDRFLATTSSEHASHMLSHFEYYRDTEWGGADVALANVTEAWAVIVVAGPVCRQILGTVLGEQWQIDLARLRHMGFTTGRWHKRELRLLRASFSGELAFELHCHPDTATALWQALVDAGLAPYGLEALEILRLEKGYLSGSEINGQTTPFDLGMDDFVDLGNQCIGRALLDRPAFREPSRPKLVGLRAVDGLGPIDPGAQIATVDAPNRALGHVTAATYSPALREWIALGLVSRWFSSEGTLLLARDLLHDRDTNVRVTATVHFDPKGERIKS